MKTSAPPCQPVAIMPHQDLDSLLAVARKTPWFQRNPWFEQDLLPALKQRGASLSLYGVSPSSVSCWRIFWSTRPALIQPGKAGLVIPA